MHTAAGNDFEGMRQQRENRLKALGGAALAAGQVDNQRTAAQARDRAAEPCKMVRASRAGAHGLGQSRNLAVDQAARGLGGHIPRPQAGSAHGQDEPIFVVAKLMQQGANGLLVIGNQTPPDGLTRPLLLDQADHGLARSIRLGTGKTTVGDGNNCDSLHILNFTATVDSASAHNSANDVPPAFTLLRIEGPNLGPNFKIPAIHPHNLPLDWRTNQEATRDQGTAWLRKNSGVLLRVPSAIVPEATNFPFNPSHPDAAKFNVAETFSYPFDMRLKKLGQIL